MRCLRSLPSLGFVFVRGACLFSVAACGTEATVLGLNPPPAASSRGDASAPEVRDSGADWDAAVVDTSPDVGADAFATDSRSENGAAQCAPCSIGQGCAVASDCQSSVGAACVNATCVLSRSCAELKSRNPAANDGIYTIDVDGPDAGFGAFPVLCDMTTNGGGWTRVAFEPARSGGDHIQGNLAYLGVEVGAPDAVATGTGPGLLGARFNGTYHELGVTWGVDYARMTVTQDIFVNQVAVAIGVANFVTSNATLGGWVSTAGGAVFCRASRSPDARPGDTSWALKPSDSAGMGCGCDDPTWRDRGAFYGGVLQSTTCSPWGGGWAGVRADGQNKAGLASTTDLSLWIR